MSACEKWDLYPDNIVVVLDGGKSEDDLMILLDKLTWWCGNSEFWEEPRLGDDDVVVFREPDLLEDMTGFAIVPGKLPDWVLSIPLLFSEGGESK